MNFKKAIHFHTHSRYTGLNQVCIGIRFLPLSWLQCKAYGSLSTNRKVPWPQNQRYAEIPLAIVQGQMGKIVGKNFCKPNRI